MDVNKIFRLFNGEEFDSLPKESQVVEAAIDFKEHPLFWVGMFKKLIQNHKVYNRSMINFFSKMDEELDLYDVESAGEFIVYNRAWFWINKIDITDTKHQDSIIHYTDDLLLTYIKFAISYFQDIEEYEKCAHLKKIQDLVEKFLT